MIVIDKNETKDVYVTLSEKQTLIATTVSFVYYLWEAESNDTHNKSYWYSEDESTNVDRYNQFTFVEGGTFSYNGEFTLDVGTSALAGTLDLDWIINGDSNTFDFDINYDGATNYVDVDGDSNTVNFTGSGYAGGYFYLDQTGNSRTFNIIQSSTLVSDWLQINSTGNGGTICVTQNDGGTSTSC